MTTGLELSKEMNYNGLLSVRSMVGGYMRGLETAERLVRTLRPVLYLERLEYQ